MPEECRYQMQDCLKCLVTHMQASIVMLQNYGVQKYSSSLHADNWFNSWVQGNSSIYNYLFHLSPGNVKLLALPSPTTA